MIRLPRPLPTAGPERRAVTGRDIAYRQALPIEQTPTGTAEEIYPDHHSHCCVTARVLDPAGDPFRGDIDLQNIQTRIPGIHGAAALAHLIGPGRAGQTQQKGQGQ